MKHKKQLTAANKNMTKQENPGVEGCVSDVVGMFKEDFGEAVGML
jgi:hypothetical protein